ncbi:MAG: hypothetical protein ACE5QW_05660 [Thermoplasmata archaeon]
MDTPADRIKSQEGDSTPVRLLFELSGEHPGLSLLELSSVVEALQGNVPSLTKETSIAIIETHLEPEGIGDRIALCHRVNEIVSSGSLESLLKVAKEMKIGGSVAVRCRKVLRSRKERCSEIEKQFGNIFARSHSIDLVRPSTLIRVILGRENYLTIQRHEVDRKSYDRRKVALRPFFYPISLHPKFARLLVNMTKVRKGETLLDPFCGTGGILIEAGLVGAAPIGSDLRGDMVEGCRVNLKKFGVKADLFQADINDIDEHVNRVNAIATDPPYGRSTSTKGRDILGLYSKSFEVLSNVLENGRNLAIIVPREDLIDSGKEYMELEASHSLRVHKSLTRHFCLFKN